MVQVHFCIYKCLRLDTIQASTKYYHNSYVLHLYKVHITVPEMIYFRTGLQYYSMNSI